MTFGLFWNCCFCGLKRRRFSLKMCLNNHRRFYFGVDLEAKSNVKLVDFSAVFCSILERVTFNILYLCTASGKTHSVTVLFRISICSRVFLIILVLNPLSQKDVGSMLMGAPGLIQLSVLDNDISGSI